MTFNVRLCFQPPTKCHHSVKYKEGLKRYEVTGRRAPCHILGAHALCPRVGGPHKRTHADHTYTAQTHARVPTVKYMYRGTRLHIYIYRERDVNPGRRWVPQAQHARPRSPCCTWHPCPCQKSSCPSPRPPPPVPLGARVYRAPTLPTRPPR